ncbi:MAG: cytochrome c3 family protein [Desulfuromonadales bacterium]|jgi:hypothetical protein
MGWNRKILLLFIVFFTASALLCRPAGAADQENETCLGCHGDAGTVGDEFRIDPLKFDHTAHGELGCTTCHQSVSTNHPEDGKAPSRPACRDCHPEVSEEYAHTAHAANASCGDCHNPHQVHAATAVSGMDMNRQCSACHDPGDMKSAHGAWLPQADLHLQALPCVSCHTGSKNYVITLYMVRRDVAPRGSAPNSGATFVPAGYGELRTLAGSRGIQSLIDANGDGVVSLAELKQFNSQSGLHGLRLKGMLTPEVVTHSLQILDNRWDCTFCHASGPGAMQTSFLALPREDGSYNRLPVEKGAVLDALNGTPDFYMMGATRNASLNLLGLAILAGGLVMPVGHGFLRFLTRKNRR